MSEDISDDTLAEIRRAAFDLRRTDPEEAVRILRRLAEQGGPAAVLAHGALAEIYLDEYGDLDGAEHEFRAVLQAAPRLPAAELGLARVLQEQGRLAEADEERPIEQIDRGEIVASVARAALLGAASALRERFPRARGIALCTASAAEELPELPSRAAMQADARPEIELRAVSRAQAAAARAELARTLGLLAGHGAALAALVARDAAVPEGCCAIALVTSVGEREFSLDAGAGSGP
ncbi:MAG: hypothetical protein NVS4B10_15800 [Myxococcales bacterium]